MPQKGFVDDDSTTLITTSAQINKELLLPPSHVLIKDSLKFEESEGEEVDVLGFEVLQTDDNETVLKSGVVVEEKVQKDKEETSQEQQKDNSSVEEEW